MTQNACVKYNSKYSMFKCNLKCLIFLRTIFYFDELCKHLDQAFKKVRLWSSVKYTDLKIAHTHVFLHSCSNQILLSYLRSQVLQFSVFLFILQTNWDHWPLNCKLNLALGIWKEMSLIVRCILAPTIFHCSIVSVGALFLWSDKHNGLGSIS